MIVVNDNNGIEIGEFGRIYDIGGTTPPVSPIYTGNIKLYLDAGNASSYPGSGTAFTDLSGLGNHGTLYSGTTIAEGPVFSPDSGGAFYFNGSSAADSKPYIKCGDDSSLNTTLCGSDFTINMWVKFHDDKHWCWLNVGALESGGYSYTLENSQTSISFNKNAVTTQNVAWTPSLDVWYNITMVQLYLDKVKYYVNGNYQGVFAYSGAYNFAGISADMNLYLGCFEAYFPDKFNGSISTVMFHGEALSQENITKNYNAFSSRYVA